MACYWWAFTLANNYLGYFNFFNLHVILCREVKVAIYSFFFHAIIAVVSTADFGGKISAVYTRQVVKNGSFQGFTTRR